MRASELILERFATLGPTLQQAAKFALDHPNEVVIGSMRALAQRASAQPASFVRLAQAIGLRLSELAILITAHAWSQPVEWAIHAPIALREGIAAETIAAFEQGRRPAALADDEAIVYDFSTELQRDRTVGDATWRRAIERFGEQGTVDLIGINGYYTLLAMVMNAARTPVPAPR